MQPRSSGLAASKRLAFLSYLLVFHEKAHPVDVCGLRHGFEITQKTVSKKARDLLVAFTIGSVLMLASLFVREQRVRSAANFIRASGGHVGS